MAAYSEGSCGEHAAVFDVGLRALFVQDVEQNTVFGLARHYYHVIEVLCSGTY